MEPAIYHTLSTVRTYECDEHKLLKPECILHLFQEVAESHAKQLGFGYEFVMAHQLAWVETRLDVAIHRMPAWNETVSISTWTAPESALLARRNMEICDQTGAPLVSATALWAIIDVNKRRPVPLKKHITAWPNTPCPESVPALQADITGLEPICRAWSAERRDMDFNRHINNSAYLIWAQADLPDERFLTHDITALRLRFKKECHAGDALNSKTYVTDAFTVHHICRGEELLCEVTLEWQKK